MSARANPVTGEVKVTATGMLAALVGLAAVVVTEETSGAVTTWSVAVTFAGENLVSPACHAVTEQVPTATATSLPLTMLQIEGSATV